MLQLEGPAVVPLPAQKPKPKKSKPKPAEPLPAKAAEKQEPAKVDEPFGKPTAKPAFMRKEKDTFETPAPPKLVHTSGQVKALLKGVRIRAHTSNDFKMEKQVAGLQGKLDKADPSAVEGLYDEAMKLMTEIKQRETSGLKQDPNLKVAEEARKKVRARIAKKQTDVGGKSARIEARRKAAIDTRFNRASEARFL